MSEDTMKKIMKLVAVLFIVLIGAMASGIIDTPQTEGTTGTVEETQPVVPSTVFRPAPTSERPITTKGRETSLSTSERPITTKGRETSLSTEVTEGTPEPQDETLAEEAGTSTEYNLFCRIVALEGHPKYGYDLYLQVATVIMNRVESDKFPDTVTEVIKQKNQFSTYKTNRKPVYNDDVYRAAEDAYYRGKRNLPSFVLAFITEEAYPKNVASGGFFGRLEVYDTINTVVWCYWPEDKE